MREEERLRGEQLRKEVQERVAERVRLENQLRKDALLLQELRR